MVIRRNDATGASDGLLVTPANSGSVTADNFQAVVSGASGSMTYANVDGVTCFKFTGTSSSNCNSIARWTMPTMSQFSGRIDCLLLAPGPKDYRYADTGSGSGVRWTLLAIYGGSFYADMYISDRAGSELTPTTLHMRAGGLDLFDNAAIQLDTWFRIEWNINPLNPTGSYDVRLYDDRLSTTPTHQWTGTPTWTTPGTVTTFEFGAKTNLISADGLVPVSNWFARPYVSDDNVIPPPGLPYLSTLTDQFATLQPSAWTAIGPAIVDSGALVLGDNLLTGYVTSVTTHQFDRAEIAINAPGRNFQLWVDDVDSADFAKILIDGAAALIRTQSTIGGHLEASDPIEFDATRHRHIKLERFADTDSIAFLTSPDGLTWEPLRQTGLPALAFHNVRAILAGDLFSNVDDFNIVATPPVVPPDPDDPVDPTNPTAPSPAVGDPAAPDDDQVDDPPCVTLLDLAREFSARTGFPIRLTSHGSIEVVHPFSPLPIGYTAADADEMYTTTRHSLVAGVSSLTTDGGDIALTVTALSVADDVRLAVSEWKPPAPLPAYGLGAAMVRRYTQTFSPTGYRSECEFSPLQIPLEFART